LLLTAIGFYCSSSSFLCRTSSKSSRSFSSRFFCCSFL
jgi:hypothetical protein